MVKKAREVLRLIKMGASKSAVHSEGVDDRQEIHTRGHKKYDEKREGKNLEENVVSRDAHETRGGGGGTSARSKGETGVAAENCNESSERYLSPPKKLSKIPTPLSSQCPVPEHPPHPLPTPFCDPLMKKNSSRPSTPFPTRYTFHLLSSPVTTSCLAINPLTSARRCQQDRWPPRQLRAPSPAMQTPP
jgi:hypothetical protein